MKITDDLEKYIEDPNKFEIDFSFDNAKNAQTNNLSRIIYTDTDSSFTWLYFLIQKIIEHKYGVSDSEFEKMVKIFDEDSFDKGFSQDELIELIQKISEVLEEFINENVLKKFGKYHRIADEWNMLSFKQEYIFSAIYLVQIKNYVYRSIAEKGVRITDPDDQYDYLNIGIKSDKAEITNKIIQNLVKIFLLKDPESSIPYALRYINSVREKIKSKELFIPVSLSKRISEYTSNVEIARGALIYEKITGQEGIFQPGTKGKLYKVSMFNWNMINDADRKIREIEAYLRENWKVKGNIRSAINVIVIPENDEKFNLDLFELDEEAQLIKLLIKPLQSIYQPVNIDISQFVNIDKRKLK